jgi:hypothetical protein
MPRYPVPARCRLFVAALAMAMAAPPALHAHAVTVDGSIADWPLIEPAPANLGRIARGAGGIGAFAWNDGFNDETHNDNDGADLIRVRITATPTHLSFIARMANIGVTSGAGAPIVQVAIDLDRVEGSGQLALYGNAETQVRGDARWEYLVQTRFGSGALEVETFDAALTSQGTDPAAIVATGPDCIEFSIPWSRIGLTGPPSHALRFTVATFVSAAGNAIVDLDGIGVSNLYDCVTNYGNPGSQPNTSPTEAADGDIDYAFDVHFLPSGEPHSPLRIGEVLVNPATAVDAEGEWVEIVNASSGPQSLDGFKFGDEETPDAGEGMFAFPNGVSVGPAEVVVVAGHAGTFFSQWGSLPDFELIDSDPGIAQLAPYAGWSGATFLLGNFGDEVLLLDRWDTVVDALTYGSGVFAGVSPATTVDENQSYARTPIDLDRDSCAADFAVQSSPTPGTAGPVSDVADPAARGLSLSPARPNPARGAAVFTLSLAEPSRVRATVLDVTGRRVRSLAARELAGGDHRLAWDLRDTAGRRVASGRYYVHVAAAGGEVSRPLIVID